MPSRRPTSSSTNSSQLFEATAPDFTPVYREMEGLEDLAAERRAARGSAGYLTARPDFFRHFSLRRGSRDAMTNARPCSMTLLKHSFLALRLAWVAFAAMLATRGLQASGNRWPRGRGVGPTQTPGAGPGRHGPRSPLPGRARAGRGGGVRRAAGRPWTGDLDGMVERRFVRMLVTTNATNYFVDLGQAGRRHVRGWDGCWRRS